MKRALALFLAFLAWVLAVFFLSNVALHWIQTDLPHRRVSAALLLPIALLILAGAIGLSAWIWRNWGPLGGEPDQGEEGGPLAR